MHAIKEVYELIRKTYGLFFPTSRIKREDFLKRVKHKVEYYKPKIEERCNMDLGEVNVKDNKCWLFDVSYGSAYQNAFETARKQGRFPTKLDIHMSFTVASTAEALLILPTRFYNHFSGADFRHHNSTIYVPFYYMNRFSDIDFKERSKRIDYGVVHELSHTLWEKIIGISKGYWGEGRLWFEGFATYCADNYFADFYPEEVEKVSSLPKPYVKGKRKIEELVAQHGKEILLEVPKKWEELSFTSTKK